ncbi:protein croquemort isoform X2 [Aethina tumida]|uniref:protein croquemort isoform X2 n=1 Tax=Aethina tumida TaxID=116153 RepID=UPI002149100D|nr:protein croquemort isoform X2 [Aethina tumida]
MGIKKKYELDIMGCCGRRCQKWSTFSTAAVLLVLGLVLSIWWTMLFQNVVNKQLSLGSKDTKGYKMWKETPIPMYIEFYLWNWTNVDEFKDNQWPTKPKFEELGPYTYSEHHIREQVVFNDNNTITYKTKKIYKFLPEKSNGKLTDKITTINVILASVADLVRSKNIIVRDGIEFFILEKHEQFIITKTAQEFLFDGYDDPFINLAKKLHIKGMDIPYDKFGWFYNRNGSADYDGVLNMYNGADSISKLGRLAMWNYEPRVDDYPGECGKIQGTSGELWYPPHEDDVLEVFAPDICSTLKLRKNNTIMHNGIKGYRYVAGEEVFGNDLPENKCYIPDGTTFRSGVRTVQKCKFNAPAYVSYPHFYLADPWYREQIDGMEPNSAEHVFYLSLEPSTGLPLNVHAALQVNIRIRNCTGIKYLENVKETYFPMLWFKQTAELTEDLSSLAKLMLVMPNVGTYTGYGFIGLGTLLLTLGVVITFRRGWKDSSDDERLLNQQSL